MQLFWKIFLDSNLLNVDFDSQSFQYFLLWLTNSYWKSTRTTKHLPILEIYCNLFSLLEQFE